MRTNRQLRAFSLIEIVIVTGILTVITGIVVVAYSRVANGPKASRVLQMSKAYAGYIREAAQNNRNFRGQLPVTRTGGGGTIPLTGQLALPANATAAEIGVSFDLVMTAERMIELFSEIPYGEPARPSLAIRWDTTNRVFVANPDVAASVSAIPTTMSWQRIESRVSNPALSPDVAQGANFQSAPGVGLPAQVVVVYWRLPNAPQAFAEELAKKANKPEHVPPSGAACAVGPVAYAAPSSGVTDVYVYIYHQ